MLNKKIDQINSMAGAQLVAKLCFELITLKYPDLLKYLLNCPQHVVERVMNWMMWRGARVVFSP